MKEWARIKRKDWISNPRKKKYQRTVKVDSFFFLSLSFSSSFVSLSFFSWFSFLLSFPSFLSPWMADSWMVYDREKWPVFFFRSRGQSDERCEKSIVKKKESEKKKIFLGWRKASFLFDCHCYWSSEQIIISFDDQIFEENQIKR